MLKRYIMVEKLLESIGYFVDGATTDKLYKYIDNHQEDCCVYLEVDDNMGMFNRYTISDNDKLVYHGSNENTEDEGENRATESRSEEDGRSYRNATEIFAELDSAAKAEKRIAELEEKIEDLNQLIQITKIDSAYWKGCANACEKGFATLLETLASMSNMRED